MQQWKYLMQSAKLAYQEKAYQDSIKFNRLALDTAHDTFDRLFISDPERALASVIVSYLSLIDSYIAIGDMSRAHQIFQQALNFLRALGGSSVEYHDEQNAALISATYKVRLELMRFIKRYMSSDTENGGVISNDCETMNIAYKH